MYVDSYYITRFLLHFLLKKDGGGMGFPERNSDIEICGDCHWAVKYLVAERKDLQKATMARLKDKTYQNRWNKSQKL